MEEVFPGKKLLSQKHLSISTFIGGPLMAGAIAGHNLWALKLRWKAFGIILSGLILTLILEFSLALFARYVLYPLNIELNFWVRLIAVLSSQALFAYFIFLFLQIKKLKALIFPLDANYYGKSQIIGISLLSFAYLLVHIDIPILFAHFPNMILLFYVMPQIYLYNRTKYLFTSQKHIIMARWVVVIIACYMPLVFAVNDLLPKAVMNLPMFLAESYIYILLYLFLLVWGVDLLGQLSNKLQLIPAHIIRHQLTKVMALLVVFVALIIILITGNKRYNQIVVNEFNIEVPAKDAEIDSLTICFVADMHLNNFTSNQFIDDYVQQLSRIDPDIILYGGDILERSRISEDKIKDLDKKLGTLKPLYGKYIIGGNHDNYRLNGYDNNSDLFFLSDTVVKVASSFYLMGTKYRSYAERPISELKKTTTENLPIFLLDHAPYQLEATYENKIDIQLSGHTHNGQVWPINYIIQLMFEIPWGYEKSGIPIFLLLQEYRVGEHLFGQLDRLRSC